jgi:isocitrate/isopropylmalate dehydrogenase
MIRAAALMLSWTWKEHAAAAAIEHAVVAVLAEGLWPHELAGAAAVGHVRALDTEAMGEAVIDHLPSAPVTSGQDTRPPRAMLEG